MIDTIYATTKEMTQAWDKNGRRLAITKLLIEPNVVVGSKEVQVKADKQNVDSWTKVTVAEIGYGRKKMKNMPKAMRARLEKLALTNGVAHVDGVRELAEGETLVPGTLVPVEKMLQVGDVVAVQGTTKGRGFAGGMKRHNFHGGPKTHGQADRARAVGSVGNRTTPGRVWLGKRLPGHMGVATKTVKGLVVAYFNPETRELWLTGPVPGWFNGVVKIKASGSTRKDFALDLQASGLAAVAPVKVSSAPAATAEVQQQEVQ